VLLPGIGAQIVKLGALQRATDELVPCRAQHGGPADGEGVALLEVGLGKVDVAGVAQELLATRMPFEGVRLMRIVAALAVPARDVQLPLTRLMLFSVAGYRTPTVQRLRLAADADGHLLALVHDVWEQTSRIKEFAEQTAVPSRGMYAAKARATTHRLAPLDVPVPSWMRAPGENPGMYAGESAMDELAIALGMDPIELRIRNGARVRDALQAHEHPERRLGEGPQICSADPAARERLHRPRALERGDVHQRVQQRQ